jgi:hypothetical protein
VKKLLSAYIMNSKQDYINIYRKICTGLDIYGDSAELLIQLLAEATYISEVEHVVYTQEASLEKASLLNSKIQHCMNDMYSVYRGSCPRVIFRFTPSNILILSHLMRYWQEMVIRFTI